MTEYEWLTCKDPERMCNETGLFNQRRIIAYNGLFLSPVSSPDGLVTIYLQRSLDEHAFMWKQTDTPSNTCDLIREVVGNPFRPIYHVKDYLNDPRASYHVQATAQTSTREHQELIKELNNRVFLPEWLTGDVYYFAANIVESGDYQDVDVLADFLEEAGCDNEEILRHLRQEVRCPEWLVKPIDEWFETKKCSSLTRHTCNSGWHPKPVPCQAGCWVLRLLVEVTK